MNSPWKMQPPYANDFAQPWGARGMPRGYVPPSDNAVPRPRQGALVPDISDPPSKYNNGRVRGAITQHPNYIPPSNVPSNNQMSKRDMMIAAAVAIVLVLAYRNG